MAKAYVDYFADEKHRELFEKLLLEVTIPKKKNRQQSKKFTGINFLLLPEAYTILQKSCRGKRKIEKLWRKSDRFGYIENKLSD